MPDPLDLAPPSLVAQIVRHWETYRPRMAREMKAAGTFDESVRQAALMTCDAEYDAMTRHGLTPGVRGRSENCASSRASRSASPAACGTTRRRRRKTWRSLELSVPADMGTVACDPPEGWSKRA